MKSIKSIAALGMAMGLSVAGTASATTAITADITNDTVWTKAGNPYKLVGPISVKNGAALTIEKGVVIANIRGEDGGLVVTRGSQIFVLGTASEPVIMTSAEDVATWTGSVVTTGTTVNGPDGVPATGDEAVVFTTGVTTVGNPKSGTWRLAANEWRNLTVMGRGVISASWFDTDGDANPGAPGPISPAIGGGNNPTIPNGTSQKQMEGLTAIPGQEDDVRYGGADDDDDSGIIRYLSIRYTGRVVGAGNELNGLSLGALGRETEVTNIDIMNNVDDGIEVWGGTANFKWVNIWNIGDDSFDLDQGWRGKAQFGLIVQGWALNASSGSGRGDNCIEFDGAESSASQPLTTGTIYNFTAIGQPVLGDHGTAWRDNARMQFRNCIFMDLGEALIKNDDSDGDGGWGYTGTKGSAGGNPHLSFADTWTTAYTVLPAANAGVGDFAPAALYTAQSAGDAGIVGQGFLAEMTDSVFYNNLGTGGSAAYTESDARGVTVAGDDALDKANIVAASSPIASITRTTGSVPTGEPGLGRVTALDPRALNDALTSEASAPNDGFFTPAAYRGAFSGDNNWARGWTAADAFGFFTGAANPATPTVTLKVQLTTLTFSTVSGVNYIIESSTNGENWSYEATVAGDGTTKTVSAIVTVDPAKIYRVRVE